MPKNGVFNILIVDDSAAIVQYLKYIVSKRPQFSAIGVYTAEDAIFQVEVESPDIILLDLNLPGMSGLSACKIIKENHPDLPIIAITGELDPENRFLAYQAGACDFIAKPFNADEVLAHIKHHLHLTALDAISLGFSK